MGERTKILLAILFLKDNKFLLIDEPINFIDVFTKIQIENVIINYKLTIIFLSHDYRFGENVCTKILDI